MIKGKVIKFGDNIDTDQIIGSSYLSLPTIDSMKPYCFINHKNFKEHFRNGDIIVANENFGCGSSREQAPAILKALNVGVIIAKTYARIFYRNSINLGIPVIECKDVEFIDELDELEVSLEKGIVYNKTKDEQYKIEPIPEFMLNILNRGGIVPYKKAQRA